MARQDFGSLGPARGSPVSINCPVGDALRSVLLWLVLLALLLRPSNRNRQAWALVPALGAIFLILHVAESSINAHTIFYLHRHMCTILCEMLRTLAGAIAVLLALSDLLPRRRLLRFAAVFLVLFAAGATAILLNAPVVSRPPVWITLFGLFLLAFLLGHAILRTLLRWRAGPRQLAWSTGISLLLGLAPLVAFVVIGSILNRSVHLQNVTISFRFAMVLAHAFLGPYFILFWFLLPGLLLPPYRQRLARSFGYDGASEPFPNTTCPPVLA